MEVVTLNSTIHISSKIKSCYHLSFSITLPPRLFSAEDIHLNSRTFLWPKEMEAVLKLSESRLAHRRDIVEGVLRSKRTDFDAK